MSSTEVADVLERAADLLYLRGRATRTPWDLETGEICPESAICAARDQRLLDDRGTLVRAWEALSRLDDPALAALRRYLSQHPELLGAIRDLHRLNRLRVMLGFEQGLVFPQRYDDVTWLWNDALPPGPESDALVHDTLLRCAKELRSAEPT